jgi:Serine dehydrogenase proteinase
MAMPETAPQPSDSDQATLAPGYTTPSNAPPKEKPPNWLEFLKTANDTQIGERLGKEIEELAVKALPNRSQYCLLGIYEPHEGIASWDATRIYAALKTLNPNKDKAVFLLLESNGGKIEPAYQISKICKQFAKDRFVVVVPRAAKSAATLIALGADEIHIGSMGELGPIDPQLGDLPALGVKRALETIASVCEEYPKSADAFAKYMSQRVTIEQIGYCERVVESAVQYAERLLSKKSFLKQNAHQIAYKLVYEYKHHGFVIDRDEATVTLGEGWVLGNTPEIAFAEQVNQLLDLINLIYDFAKGKQFVVSGNLVADVITREKSDDA